MIYPLGGMFFRLFQGLWKISLQGKFASVI